jgi:hypothetical protein
MAGRELRFGTVSMYMAAEYHVQFITSTIYANLHGNILTVRQAAFPFYNRGLMLDFEQLKTGTSA